MANIKKINVGGTDYEVRSDLEKRIETLEQQDAISEVNLTVDDGTGTPFGSASVSGSTLNISLRNIKGEPGETGPANTITIGTVTPSDSTDEASAVMRGEAPNQILDLVLPRGRQGNSGVTGDTSDIVVVNDLNGGESEVGAIKVLAAEQGKVLNQKFQSINETLDGIWYNYLLLENGTLDDSTGQVIDDQTLAPKRLRSINYETNNGGILINKSEGIFLVIVEYFNELGGNYVSRVEYTSEDVVLNNAYKFFKVIVKRNDETEISYIEVKDLLIWTKNKPLTFENGTLKSDTGQVIDSPTLTSKRLRSVNYEQVVSGLKLFNNSNGQLFVLVNYYNSISGDYVKQISFTSNHINFDISYKYYKLIVKKYGDEDITPTEGNAIVVGDIGTSDKINSMIEQVNQSETYNLVLENGTLDDATGQPVNNVSLTPKRLRSINYELVIQGTIVNKSSGDCQIIIEYFDVIGGNYVVQKPYTTDNISLDNSFPYYKIIIKRTDGGDISPSDTSNIIFVHCEYNLFTKLEKDIYGIQGSSLMFENGTLDSSTGQVITNATLTPKRLRSVDFINVMESQVIKNDSNDSLLVLINYYNEIGGNYVKQIDFSANDIVLNGSYKYYKLIVKKSNDGEITTSEAKSIYISAGGLLSRVSALENNSSNGTGINDVLLKSNALLLDFILPDVPAQNGTDESALLNLNTVTVAEYYAALNTIINNKQRLYKKGSMRERRQWDL